MRKKLVVIGNGLGILLDKHTRALLGIEPNTEFEVTTDGRRLTFEPIINKPPALSAYELDALPVFNVLVDKFQMGQDRFARLHHAPMRMFAYRGGLQTGLVDRADDHDRATFRRFRACLHALQRGAAWDDAITVALNLEPKLGSPTGKPSTQPA